MVDAEVVRDFFSINSNINVVYVDSGKDFIIKGLLRRITDTDLVIDSDRHGVSIIALSAVKKVFNEPVKQRFNDYG